MPTKAKKSSMRPTKKMPRPAQARTSSMQGRHPDDQRMRGQFMDSPYDYAPPSNRALQMNDDDSENYTHPLRSRHYSPVHHERGHAQVSPRGPHGIPHHTDQRHRDHMDEDFSYGSGRNSGRGMSRDMRDDERNRSEYDQSRRDNQGRFASEDDYSRPRGRQNSGGDDQGYDNRDRYYSRFYNDEDDMGNHNTSRPRYRSENFNNRR